MEVYVFTAHRRFVVSGAVLLGVGALVAGCASAPSDGGGSTVEVSSNFLPCLATGGGVLEDKGFNEHSRDGVNTAATALGVEAVIAESRSETDIDSNFSTLIDQDCSVIVGVGFQVVEAATATAKANPDVDFAIVDDNSIDLPNVKGIAFDTSQAAFLAGYAAADYSTSGVVGTFGGMSIPPITTFMDGFVDGVEYYNQQTGKSVKTLGWDQAGQTGSFTGGFSAGVDAKAVAQGLIDQGADVLLPVGGPIYQSAGEAIFDSGKDIALIGVDTDLTVTDPKFAELALTSILKQIETGVTEAVEASADGTFTNQAYIGTLENKGVGLAPFHSFESKVSPDLQSRLDTITKGIIDGSIVVNSPTKLT